MTNKISFKKKNKIDPKVIPFLVLGLILVAPPVWAAELSPNDDVIVAIVDTGMDFKNPELQKYLWTNPGEKGLDENGNDKATNGIDDDNNGFIDDVHGWDFVDNSANPQDHHGHGSHISGLVLSQIKNVRPELGAERRLNRTPSSSSPPKIRLMILKYYDQTFLTTDTLENTIRAFRYATKMGAQIINYSGGGSTPNGAEYSALKEAQDKDLLVIAAAGNDGRNLDYKKFFPANYPLKNILSITAVDSKNDVLTTSNFSSQYVDLAAPGKNQISWLPGSHLGPMTGTSQATALATGAAASFLLLRPEFKNRPVDLIRYLKAGAQTEGTLFGKVQNAALLNAETPPLLHDSGESPFGFSLETTPTTSLNAGFQKD